MELLENIKGRRGMGEPLTDRIARLLADGSCRAREEVWQALALKDEAQALQLFDQILEDPTNRNIVLASGAIHDLNWRRFSDRAFRHAIDRFSLLSGDDQVAQYRIFKLVQDRPSLAEYAQAKLRECGNDQALSGLPLVEYARLGGRSYQAGAAGLQKVVAVQKEFSCASEKRPALEQGLQKLKIKFLNGIFSAPYQIRSDLERRRIPDPVLQDITNSVKALDDSGLMMGQKITPIWEALQGAAKLHRNIGSPIPHSPAETAINNLINAQLEAALG